MGHKEEIKGALDMGALLPDALNTLRRGSALDRMIATVSCKNCPNTVTRSIRELNAGSWRCPCGGFFDFEPLTGDISLLYEGRADLCQHIKLLPKLNEPTEEN